MSPDAIALRRIKLLHTAAWVFFVAFIIAIPVFTARSEFRYAMFCSAVVAVEVLVLVVNSWSCPLTAIASRYTDDRHHNFDIYLPEWLAHYNKVIFGTLYGAGLLYLLASWLLRAGPHA